MNEFKQRTNAALAGEDGALGRTQKTPKNKKGRNGAEIPMQEFLNLDKKKRRAVLNLLRAFSN